MTDSLTSSVPESSPVGERSRYLDVLRGIAILGILPVNIPFMAMPVEHATGAPSAEGWEPAAIAATRILAEYKFVTLFSVLFGVGLVLLRERSTAGTIVRRLLVLWFFGALHATLLFWGDIVSYYAPIGLIVVWAWKWRIRTLAWTGAVLAAVPAILMLIALPVVGALSGEDWMRELFAPDPQAHPSLSIRSWADFGSGLTNWSPSFQEAVFKHGTYLQATALRAIMWAAGLLLIVPYWGWRTLGLFLVGMALARSGWFLRPSEHPDRFRRLAIVGLGAGLPLEIAGACMSAGSPVPAVAGELLHYVGSFGMAAAYAGGVGLLVGRAPRPLEFVGRSAFSNYIAQSAIGMVLFTGAGLGWYGSVGRVALLGIVAGVWALNLLFSTLWMSRFRFGPLEWLWRSATRMRIQAIVQR